MRTFKLLNEVQDEGLEYIYEEQNRDSGGSHYLQGPFMMAEVPNKNHRKYSLTEMTNEVERYMKDYVKTNRALGELNHPANSTEINLERAAHMVVNIERKDNMFYGKTKILSTPCGTVTKQLLSDGVRIGISSRALGRMIPEGNINVVEGLHLICLDLVHEPSAPAMLDSIMESSEYLIDEGGRIVELAVRDLRKRVSSLPKSDLEGYIAESFKRFFDTLRSGK